MQVIKTYWELGHKHKFITEIVARRSNECIVSITKPDYKNLNKNDIEDIYLLIMNGKVPDVRNKSSQDLILPRIDQGVGSTSGIRACALRYFDLEVMELENTQNNALAKLPMLKLGEYEMWEIRIKQYFQIQDYALWEVIENGNSWVPIPVTAPESGPSTALKMTVPSTAEEKICKKNDVKARSLLLMALPNEHQLTFNQYVDAQSMFAAIKARFGGNEATKKTQKALLKQQYENFNASSSESLDSIFNRLQKLVSRLAILGVVTPPEDLNVKFLRSLPSEWDTHVVVWMNKPDFDTMGLDDLYNNFKIVEQKVKRSTGTINDEKNLAFLTTSGASSINNINTVNPEVSTGTTKVNTASTETSTASFSDATVYAFLSTQPQGSQLVHEDLEQLHDDDLEEMDLKWNMALLSMRARKFYQRTGRKIIIDGSSTAGYDKSKVECFNCHKMGHFARECRAPRSKDNRNWNQGSSSKAVRIEDASEKAMCAIDGAGFDWSDMAEEEIQANMALMAFSDSEVTNDKSCSKSCLQNYEALKKQYDDLLVKLDDTGFKASTYKRGLSILEGQILKYKESEVLFSEEIALLKRSVGANAPVNVRLQISYSPTASTTERLYQKEYSVGKDTSSQNGVAERRIGLSLRLHRTMLADSKFTYNILAEAFSNTALLCIQGVSESSTSSQQDQDWIAMPIWKDASYFGDASPNIVDDATEESHDGSNIQNNGTADQQVNTPRQDNNWKNQKEFLKLLVILHGVRSNAEVTPKSNSKRNKARLGAQGHTQEESIDYDEVFCSSARTEAIRIFLAHTALIGFYRLPKRIKSAFLCKALNGLHQAPESWLISWQCKKQTVVATSTTEAEYVAAASCCGQLDLISTADDPSAEASTNDNEEVKINATIDGHSLSITEGSLRRHLKLSDQDGVTSIPNSEIFEQLALMGYHTDSDNPKKTAWEQFKHHLTTPYESPLHAVHSHRSDEGSLKPPPPRSKIDIKRIISSRSFGYQQSTGNEDMEDDLKKTKNTYSSAYTKLILRVKKLEARVKIGKARRQARVVLSDDEDLEDDSSKQGRKLSDAEGQEKASTETKLFIQEVTPTEVIQTQEGSEKVSDEVSTAGAKQGTASEEVPIVSTAKVNLSTAGGTVTYSRRSAEKRSRQDKGKAIMIESDPKKKSKKELEQERLSYAEAIRLEEQMNEEQRAQIARDEEIARQWDEEERKRAMAEAKSTKKIDWNDPSVIRYHSLKMKPKTVAQARRNMIKYLKNQGNYKINAEHGSKKKKSPKKEKSPEKIVEEEVDTQEEMKEVVKEPGAKRKKSIPRKSTRKRQKMEEDAEKEELKGFLDIIPREEVPIEVESISTKFPIMDWRLVTDVENCKPLVHGISASRPEGFDLMLWGDLHTLFEPDEDDEIWKDQHEYNLISWRLSRDDPNVEEEVRVDPYVLQNRSRRGINTYNGPFDSKEEKIKESKLLIDELDPPRSSIFLPQFLECDSVLYEDFSKVDALPSTNNEDKVFNPGILIHENLFEVTIRVTNYAKNVKKTTNVSLTLEDFNPPLYELPFHKEVPGSETLLSFSSENEEKVFNPGILTSKGVHTSLLSELSHRGPKAFKVIKIFESPMEIFPCSYGEDIRILDVPCISIPHEQLNSGDGPSLIAPDFEASRARGFVLCSLELQILSFIMGIQYLNLID
ncbi:ribonuclease H-like domain-containing protein [Tanacetum coccineum]